MCVVADSSWLSLLVVVDVSCGWCDCRWCMGCHYWLSLSDVVVVVIVAAIGCSSRCCWRRWL